jgi:g-D-glutamyl-meso-diaminopimelate peptidase
MLYDYKMLCADAEKLSRLGAEIFSIGKSVEGRAITCVRIGGGRRRLLINGAHHGLESLTSAVIMRFLRQCLTSESIFDIRRLGSAVSLYAVTMVNPDGVEMAAHGADFMNPYHRSIIRQTGIVDFRGIWQANVHGVDLNHNYDADWQSIRRSPAPTRWGGEYPESEPETRAVASLVRAHAFDMLLAFHSQGEEIYYDFNGAVAPRSVETVRALAAVSGYTAAVPEGCAAFGGCKDWFIKEFGKEGFTVEIGRGKNPLPLEMLDEVYPPAARIIAEAWRICAEG